MPRKQILPRKSSLTGSEGSSNVPSRVPSLPTAETSASLDSLAVSQPLVPCRTSSKHALSTRSSSLSSSIAAKKKKLKHSGSFDSVFWSGAAEIVREEIDKTEVDLEIKRREFLEKGGNVQQWDEENVKVDLEARKRGLESKLPMMDQQFECLDLANASQQEISQRAFVTLFTTSVVGLNVKVQEIRGRDSSDQSNFRAAVINSYGLSAEGSMDAEGPMDSLAWDVILGKWMPRSNMTASHLFAARFNSTALAAIFGTEVEDELFSPRNGLLLQNDIERNFESGFFAIVPTAAQRKAWRDSDEKDYKIRFLDKPLVESHSSSARHRYNNSILEDTKWKDLDGRRLQFRNSFRPRARYLYFTFCLNLLRYAYMNEKHASKILDAEIGHFYWGSPKRYLRDTMLPGFVKEIGHRFENVFEDNEGSDDASMREFPATPSKTAEQQEQGGAAEDNLLREALTSQLALDNEDEGWYTSDESDEESEVDWLA